MSLASKIYCVVALLIAVALGIAGLGIYSLNNLSEKMEHSSLTAQRLGVLSRIGDELWKQVSDIKDLVMSTDENEMAKIKTQQFAANDEVMKKVTAEYDTYLPPNAGAEFTGRMPKVRAQWDKYLAILNRVADFSIQNTKAKAERLLVEISGIYTNVDDNLAKFVNINEAEVERINDADELTALSKRTILVNKLRVRLLKSQVIMANINASSDAKATDAYVKEGDETMKEAYAFVEELISLTTGERQKYYTDLKNILLEKIRPLRMEFTKNAIEDSNVKGMEIYEKEARPARTEIADYVNGLLDNGIKLVNELAAEGNAAANTAIYTTVIGSIIGLVLGAVIAIVIIRQLTASLNKIIAGLGDSSMQVDSASNQI
ncbi:MAG: MCP four helix bundle domain-containing protein, partial [Planctomycetota bacterium]|nr:MCP four helix bundle domain-containing protein [Planctomycetota bacterium]